MRLTLFVTLPLELDFVEFLVDVDDEDDADDADTDDIVDFAEEGLEFDVLAVDFDVEDAAGTILGEAVDSSCVTIF